MDYYYQTMKNVSSVNRWVIYRVIYLGAFSILLFSFLYYRGFNTTKNQIGLLLVIQLTLGFLSIFHAWVLTMFYKKEIELGYTRSSTSIITAGHIKSHLVLACSAIVLLAVIVYKNDTELLTLYQVIGSYLLGVSFMI